MSPRNSNHFKVLVIDDEPLVLEMVCNALNSAGFDVLTANNGERGIELFRQEHPVLVLTDISMPNLSGFDILRIIKKESPTTQIIVFSGQGTTDDVIKALRLGACDYLYKPLKVAFLIHTINRCIERFELIQSRINQKAMLEKQVSERTAALAETFYSTVKSLGRLIEMRDPYTYGHQQRVAVLAIAIGKELKMTRKELEVLHVAGLLHDIGKASLPVELLVKPTCLNELEMQFIKGHPQNSYELLKDIPFVESLGKNVSEIVWQHHERINGAGYPLGLKDEQIEPEAKILSVADVLEAMASHRPYRPALEMENAKQELINKRGEYYSKECVDACIKLIEQYDNNIARLFDRVGQNMDEKIMGKG